MVSVYYVGISPNIASDPKVARMAAMLRKDRHWVAGHFPAFFGSVAEHAPDGNLQSIPNDLLDEWAGNVRGWGKALREHFCDDDYLTAWHQYNGRALERLAKDRERKAAEHGDRRKSPRNLHGKSAESPWKIRGPSADVTIPEPNHTKRTENTSGGTDFEAEFDVLWPLYPKRPNNARKSSLRGYAASRKAGATAEDIRAGVEAYAAYVQREGTQPQFVRTAQVFFGRDEHWRTDYGPVAADPLAGAPPEVLACRTAEGKVRLYDDDGNQTAACLWLVGRKRDGTPMDRAA